VQLGVLPLQLLARPRLFRGLIRTRTAAQALQNNTNPEYMRRIAQTAPRREWEQKQQGSDRRGAATQPRGMNEGKLEREQEHGPGPQRRSHAPAASRSSPRPVTIQKRGTLKAKDTGLALASNGKGSMWKGKGVHMRDKAIQRATTFTQGTRSHKPQQRAVAGAAARPCPLRSFRRWQQPRQRLQATIK
jgi:hypothetical protein